MLESKQATDQRLREIKGKSKKMKVAVFEKNLYDRQIAMRVAIYESIPRGPREPGRVALIRTGWSLVTRPPWTMARLHHQPACNMGAHSGNLEESEVPIPLRDDSLPANRAAHINALSLEPGRARNPQLPPQTSCGAYLV